MRVKRSLTVSEAGLVSHSRLLAGGREMRMWKGPYGESNWEKPFFAHVEGLPITITYDGRGHAVVDRCSLGKHCVYYRRDIQDGRGGFGIRRAGRSRKVRAA